jgi:hypothetical protein
LRRLFITAVVVVGVLTAGVSAAGATAAETSSSSSATSFLGIESIFLFSPTQVDSFTFQTRGAPGELVICAADAVDPRPFPLPGAPLVQLTLSQPGRDDLTTVTTGFYNDYTACLQVDSFVRGTLTLSYAGDPATFQLVQVCLPYLSANGRIAVTGPPDARDFCKT